MFRRLLIAVAVMLLLPLAGSAQENIRLGVLLPFDGGSERSQKMVEFYRGVLMAADSVTRSSNVNLDITAISCGVTRDSMGYILASHSAELRNCNYIIGPQASAQIPALAEFCHSNNIRLVVPFSNVHNDFQIDATNSFSIDNIYIVSTPYSSRVGEVVTLFDNIFPASANVIVMHTGDATRGANVTANAIKDSRLTRNRTLFEVNIDDENSKSRIESLLSNVNDNVFVVDGVSLTAVNKVYAMLDAVVGEHQDLKVSVVGSPEWSEYVQQHLHNFYKYNTYVPSSYFCNVTSYANTMFENNYIRTFGTSMKNTTPRFAPMGFDLTMFMVRVARAHATTDDDMLRLYTSQHALQHGLLFSKDEDGAYVNRSCKLVHYSQDYKIELLSR